MTPSIRTFLLINLLLSVTLITSLAIIGNLFLEHRDLQAHLDSQLSLVGLTISAFAGENIAQHNLAQVQQHINAIPDLSNKFYYAQHQKPRHKTGYEKIQFQVWRHGKLLLHSIGVPTEPLSNGKSGFDDRWLHDKSWRTFTIYDKNTDIAIMVGEQYNFREELEGKITQDSVLIMLLTYPFLGLLIWLIVGRGLDSIKRIAAALRQREPSYLEPVDLQSIPVEIKPLIDELNKLFRRLREAFEREKRFAADAAHELRTPLAALMTQVQVALNAKTEAERKSALQKVIVGVDRSVHVVQQLLILSRTVPEVIMRDMVAVNLNEQAAQVIADLVPEALKKHSDIELKAPPEPAIIKGAATAINILLRNLIDNAIRYTPSYSKVIVEISLTSKSVILKVIDNGPGIPKELRTRVTERFFRILGNKAPGSGLGLGIVLQIASIHHADLVLDTPSSGQGLEVRLTFQRYQPKT